MFDDLHPADSGYAKMADVWFDALLNILPTPEVLPYVEITAPANGATLEVPFDIEFTYGQWTLAPGDTHVRLLIDGQDQGGYYTEDPITVSSLGPGNHILALVLANADGSLTNFFDGIEVTVSVPNSGAILQNDWSLVYVDSEELDATENGAATNAFDNDDTTFWHTEWYLSHPAHPHEIQIDLGGSYYVDGFRYLPRQDGTPNGSIAQYEFYVSDSSSEWGTVVASGTFPSSTAQQEVRFTARAGRYIRLRALSDVTGGPWTSMAEIDVLGAPILSNQAPDGSIDQPVGDVSIEIGQTVSFSATGTDPDGDTSLTYLWNFGAGSGIADSTLEDPGVVQFNSAGVFTVTLTVTDSQSLADPSPATRVVTVTPISVSPDLDGDGDVDGLDLATMVVQMGRHDCTVSTPCSADLDRDGNVDEFDLQIFAVDYGNLMPLN
jgi:hypothetical protein